MPKAQDVSQRPGAAVSGDHERAGAAASPGDADPSSSSRPRLVAVVGMHRSGTSLCAHVLNALGVGMADEPNLVPSNPKGQWERLEIVSFHDRIFDLLDRGYYMAALHDLALPPGWWSDPRVVAVKRELIAFLKPRLAPGLAIGFKDPRTARLLRLWQELAAELDAELKFVLCLRHPAEIARSLHERDGLPLDIAEYRWLVYMADIVDRLRDAEVCTIEYERWFADARENATKLVGFLKLAAGSPAEIAGALSPIVDERLSHAAPAPRPLELPLAAALYDVLRRFDADPGARAEAVRIVDQFRICQQLYQPIEREFEALSRAVLTLTQAARESGSALVSWRAPAGRPMRRCSSATTRSRPGLRISFCGTALLALPPPRTASCRSGCGGPTEAAEYWFGRRKLSGSVRRPASGSRS